MTWHYRSEEANLEYARAADDAPTETDRVRLALCQVLNLIIVGRPDEATDVVDAVGGTSWARANLEAAQAWTLGAANRLAEAEETARRVLALPDALSQAETLAAWTLTWVLSLSGRIGELSGRAEQAIAAAVRAPETAAMQSNVRYWRIQALGLAGLSRDLREYVDGLDAVMTGDTFRAGFLPVFRGWDALVAGRVGEAAAMIVEFRPLCPGHGGGWTSLFEGLLAIARGMCGDAEGSAEAVGRAREFRHWVYVISDPMVALGAAWATAAGGAVQPAITQARRAAAMAGESGQYAVEVLARQAAVGFGDRAQAADLALLARRVEGPRAPLAAAHARALRDRSPAALLDAAAGLEAAGLLLPAAEAAAQAAVLATPAELIAAAAARRAAELAARCPGARTPALIAAARPVSITERQWEIAALAAMLSNREIAERLGVSVRTVEGTSTTPASKLGLPDRAALAAYVRHVSGR